MQCCVSDFEGDDENAWEWARGGSSGPITTCSTIVLNGHGPDPAYVGKCNCCGCWENSTNWLHALGNEEQYLVRGAVVQGNFHQPGSLVQVNAHCQNTTSSILVSGVDGLLVADAAMNAMPSNAPIAEGGNPAGVPMVFSGTDSSTWTARNVQISATAGYAKNNLLVVTPDCPLCVDQDVARTTIIGEPSREYADAQSSNHSHWGAIGQSSLLPSVKQLSAARSFEQQPTFEWHMPPPAVALKSSSGNGTNAAQMTPACRKAMAGCWPVQADRVKCESCEATQQQHLHLAGCSEADIARYCGRDTTSTVVRVAGEGLSLDLRLNPSLAAVAQGGAEGVLMPATVVVSIAANITYPGCTLHFMLGTTTTTGPAGGASSLVTSFAVNHTKDSWAVHTFVSRLPSQAGGLLNVGVALQVDTSVDAAAAAPKPGTLLATLSGLSVRRLGSL